MASHSPTIVVLGATPAGVAAAVRAAREGNDVLLATYNDCIGAMWASGVHISDTQYHHPRFPTYDEYIEGIQEHYRETYGEDSSQFDLCNGGYKHEPHVAEKVLTEMVEAEAAIDVHYRYYPASVDREQRKINTVTLESLDGEDSFVVEADSFIDATYEGDLAATAGVPYRLGRESRAEYNEQHAGRIFTHIESTEQGYPRLAGTGELNIRTFGQIGREIMSGSTGEGDDAIQSYTSRMTLCKDPDNRRLPEKPPNYDRERYLGLIQSDEESKDISYPLKSRAMIQREPEDWGWGSGIPDAYPIPNNKLDFNGANFVGGADEYPEADWETREEITEAHHNHTLGMLYFIQNDEAVPESVREKAQQWGLALDEYEDNDNRPYQIYVREARRIEGRETFTENDARVAPEHDRTPIYEDSIAIAEWVMDCHDVRPERTLGSANEGDIFLSEVTRPSMMPYRIMLPKGLDNLVVPVAVSASHVGFQTIRMEPSWMHLGAAAGMAVAVAQEEETMPGTLDVDHLQQALIERNAIISFFNETEMGSERPWEDAIQYLGPKGYFDSFDARPDDPLSTALATDWADRTGTILDGERPPLPASDPADADPITVGDFVEMLRETTEQAVEVTVPDEVGTVDTCTRGVGARMVFTMLTQAS